VRDVYEILRQKEVDCARLQREIEALRIVIPLLAEEEERTTKHGPHDEEDVAQEDVAQDETGTEPVSSPLHRPQRAFWKRHRES
jgi:hypothetical protein